ncbi:MAG: AAA family ATPase [Acidimicrobiaceae bacterium]|nr:AAA family ATPase [Acidimicrobiaceae bacterium]
MIAAKTRVPSLGGLARARLQARLDAAWERPITLLVAPAGSGKTTLLSSFARSLSGTDRRAAWYQAASSDADPSVLLRHVEQALRQALPAVPGGPLPALAGASETVGAAAGAMETVAEACRGGHLVLIVDDAHTIAGSEAERALAEVVSDLPPQVHVMLSSRRPPSVDLSRWRMADQLNEIGSNDLRFRSWEIEELFVHHYHQRLRAEDLAALASLTDGWAAGLALFHLATRDKTPSERRRVLESLSRQRDTRDYLTRNVVAELDEDRCDFLVRTSVLGRLSGPWCDALLDRNDGSAVLAELVERPLFLVSDDGGATFRSTRFCAPTSRICSWNGSGRRPPATFVRRRG